MRLDCGVPRVFVLLGMHCIVLILLSSMAMSQSVWALDLRLRQRSDYIVDRARISSGDKRKRFVECITVSQQ